jgi:hypothetical protein
LKAVKIIKSTLCCVALHPKRFGICAPNASAVPGPRKDGYNSIVIVAYVGGNGIARAVEILT